MDPQLSPLLIAAISAGSVAIGSFLTFFGAIINQLLASRKEQKQWLNQQASEEKSWTRNEQKKENEYLREIYQNSLRSLSVLIGIENKENSDLDVQKKIEQVNEVHKWVTMLLLRHSSSELESALNSFAETQEEHEINRLRREIIKLSKNEESFFLNKVKDLPENNKKSDLNQVPDKRKIQISISDDYRKKQIIEGVEVKSIHKFDVEWSKIPTTQREKITDFYFDSHRLIPYELRLYIPKHNMHSKQLVLRGVEWKAMINPKDKTSADILDAWEQDYEKSYQEAKQSLALQQTE